MKSYMNTRIKRHIIMASFFVGVAPFVLLVYCHIETKIV